MLTRSLVELLNNKSVTQVSLRAVEAYGVKPTKILLFDLLDPKNSTGVWSKKSGNPSLEIQSKKTTQKILKTPDECFKTVQAAQEASHFAPTGKNPESSRGHIVFVIDVQGTNDKHETINSSLVFADLAGSEGDSALTEEFIKSVSQETLLARKLEGGVINMGLSDLQMIFRNLGSKQGLSKSAGIGLRRMIKPYINANTYINVIFCMSPSFVNCASTESTLKFAARACKLKTAPVKAKRKINYQSLTSSLKDEISEKQAIIDQLENVIHECLQDGNKKLEEKLKIYDLDDKFDIAVTPDISKQASKRKVSFMDRQQSRAFLDLKSIQEEEQSWTLDKKSNKHKRNFSTVFDRKVERKTNKIERNDAAVVSEVIKEAETDVNTQAYLSMVTGFGFSAVLKNSLSSIMSFSTSVFGYFGRSETQVDGTED
eukprot:UN31579